MACSCSVLRLKAMNFPSGDHTGQQSSHSPLWLDIFVSCSGFSPPIIVVYIPVPLSALYSANATWLPSGEKAGKSCAPCIPVSGTSSLVEKELAESLRKRRPATIIARTSAPSATHFRTDRGSPRRLVSSTAEATDSSVALGAGAF